MNADLKKKGLRPQPGAGDQSIDRLNADLKKKGLRPGHADGGDGSVPFECRPEKEGIKTTNEKIITPDSRLNADLKKKGLRRGGSGSIVVDGFECRPGKEGIKTLSAAGTSSRCV